MRNRINLITELIFSTFCLRKLYPVCFDHWLSSINIADLSGSLMVKTECTESALRLYFLPHSTLPYEASQ